ncbi:hypothetical protein GOP47_0005841 [Adiantum capillus-veneris]|uniref:VQ domain-containing protein n=1 Tax=Adiantum capillus-veneris TaxID=13818 RepID=A0A9D4ZNM8_ADICA|nr:hypothetical protein GOP47_0005841 [Adiantum capillus-veneris]
MRHVKQSSCGPVYHIEDPFPQTPKQENACHSSSVISTNSPMASSVHYVQTPLKTPEEEKWNGRSLFMSQDEEGLTSAHRSENAHVRFDGHNNAENIDPHLEAAAVALSVQSAAGLGRARPGKRKSRVSSKVPIRVFSADADNFMAMVHKLTGLHSSTCLFPDTPQNPLLKPLPYRPVMQGMFTPEFSAYPSHNKMTSNLNTDNSPNTWSHSNFASNQSVQVASFHNSGPLTNKSLSMQGGYTSVAISPSIQQLMKEASRKNECGTDMHIMSRLLNDNVSDVGQKNRNLDQGPGREAWDCEGL